MVLKCNFRYHVVIRLKCLFKASELLSERLNYGQKIKSVEKKEEKKNGVVRKKKQKRAEK